MRVCMVSKFPPIEGGIASRTYWLAKGLAERGVSIDIVTNAQCVEPEYRMQDCAITDCDLVGDFSIHNISTTEPWHIPFSVDYASRLLGVLLEVIDNKNIDVIDSGYLVPYGIVGCLASQLTGIPHIVRHGGSDIAKFLDNPEYHRILALTLSSASVVITTRSHAESLTRYDAPILIQEDYVPSKEAFCVARKTNEVPVFAYIGKINYHWDRRGLTAIVNAFKNIEPGLFELKFISQGKGVDDFIRSVGPESTQFIQFESFVPPWNMPEKLATIDYLLSLTGEDPIEADSFIGREAVIAGVKVIDNNEILKHRSLRSLIIEEIDSFEPRESLPNNGRQPDEGYERWILDNLGLIRSLCT